MEHLRTYRRKLPHWELQESTYFVTFDCVPGLALSDAAKDAAFSCVRFHAEKKYRLFACVVMETHVHALLQPLPLVSGDSVPNSRPTSTRCYTLAQTTHSIKSYSSNAINQCLHRTGRVWLDESYDRIMRDEKEFLDKMEYIATNPVKAGLVEEPEKYRWLFLDVKL